MSVSNKNCEKCGKKIDKNTSFKFSGKYFCSEEHAQEYMKIEEEQMKEFKKKGGGCC